MYKLQTLVLANCVLGRSCFIDNSDSLMPLAARYEPISRFLLDDNNNNENKWTDWLFYPSIGTHVLMVKTEARMTSEEREPEEHFYYNYGLMKVPVQISLSTCNYLALNECLKMPTPICRVQLATLSQHTCTFTGTSMMHFLGKHPLPSKVPR